MAENGNGTPSIAQQKRQLTSELVKKAKKIQVLAGTMAKAKFGDKKVTEQFVEDTVASITQVANEWKDGAKAWFEQYKARTAAFKKGNDRRKYKDLFAEWESERVEKSHVVIAYHEQMIEILEEELGMTFQVIDENMFGSHADRRLARAARTKMDNASNIYNLRDMTVAMRKEFLPTLKLKYNVTAPPDFDMGKV